MSTTTTLGAAHCWTNSPSARGRLEHDEKVPAAIKAGPLIAVGLQWNATAKKREPPRSDGGSPILQRWEQIALRQTRDPYAGMRFVAGIEPDQHSGERFDDPSLLEWPGINAPQPLDPLNYLRNASFVCPASPCDQHVLVETMAKILQPGSAHRVQRADYGYAVRDHLLRLFGRRTLRDPKRAGRLAANRGRERYRGVDHELSLAQDGAQVGKVLGLVAERDAEEDELVLTGGLLVLPPSNIPPGTLWRALPAASSARLASREPMTMDTPALPRRTARPKPRAPVAPRMVTASGI